MASDKPAIAYVGVGLMGGPMAALLAARGYRVSAFDVDPGRLAAVAEKGVTAAASAADAARGADCVLLNLPWESAVEAAVFGEDGVAGWLTANSVVVDFSTVSPAFCTRIAAAVSEKTGAVWIDAPVSGGPPASEAGELTIMAGGPEDAIARLKPLFDTIGRQFTRAGDTGAGAVAKAIAQLVVATNYAVLAEAARLAEAAGMDAALLPECVRYGHADGELMRQLYPRIVAHDFAPRAYARQLLKDLEMVQDVARAAGAPTPMSGQATQLFKLLVASGLGGIDGTGVYRLYAGSAGNGITGQEVESV
ncbi:NAD(P)-dependent oxidoreductase [Microbaculum marinum]|uniref:NAD(P)-dependent oxidoreductase n=1 Tax=Microbaculum marinum TaxID=1764581 RepID=A0AAW9RM20_9HYPH